MHDIGQMLKMLTKFGFSLYFLSIHQILLIQANTVCFWRNQSSAIVINCNDGCCMGIAMSPQAACCATTSWSSFAIPVFVVTGVCLFAICLVYFRPLLKHCFCGCKCPCGHRARVTSSSPTAANTNPVYNINNDDLPDYETISKDQRPKDITPPPYTFVAAHPTDFGIEPRVPSAPPQYRSRSNSMATVSPIVAVQS